VQYIAQVIIAEVIIAEVIIAAIATRAGRIGRWDWVLLFCTTTVYCLSLIYIIDCPLRPRNLFLIYKNLDYHVGKRLFFIIHLKMQAVCYNQG